MTSPMLRLTGDHLSERGRQAWQRYNAPRTPMPDRSVLDQFADSVARYGEQAAVADESGQLTYRELDERADRAAAALSALGVTPGDFVGLFDGRCVETYVALLGVLKSGAAYVPLNPLDPPARLRSIAADCGLATVVSPGSHARPEGVFPTVDVSSLASGPEARGFPGVPIDPDRIAYVIHTSGSTGAPKGVRVRHSSVANFVAWVRDRCPAGPGDVVAQTARLFFDPSVQQIFPAWASGACLVPVPVELLLEPLAMMAWLARRRVTHLDMVTPHWAGVSAAVEASASRVPVDLPDLRWVVVGGDSMRYEHVARWHRVIRGPGRLVQVYGPTEATVNATEYAPYDGQTVGRVPIGHPLPNYELFVVDGSGWLCAPHSLGEIYIAGAGIAAGYTDPQATEVSFLADPRPGARPGDLIYRTGDLGRLVRGINGEWEIAFAGRRGSYVKVSGYRVEPEDVESAVLRCPGVDDCAVVLAGTGATSTLLCLYVAGDDLEPVLRERLAESLPRYMIPGRFRRVDRLEYTLSGKLDRAAMADRHAAPEPPRRTAAAGTGMEPVLRELWAAELGLPDFEPGDSFFEAGGSSLVALGLIAKVKNRFGVEVRVMDLYRHPDLAGFAGLVAGRLAGAEVPTVQGPGNRPSSAVPRHGVRTAEIRDALRQRSPGPLSGETFACLGGWTRETEPVGSVLVAVPIDDASDEAACAAVGDLVAGHSLLRTTVQLDPARMVHAVHAMAPFTVPIVTLTDGMREVLSTVVAMPWRVARELPFRAVLGRDESGAGHLLLWVSHTVADGESQAILSADLRRALAARAQGTNTSIEDTAPSYRRHVAALVADAAALDDEARQRLSWRQLLPAALAGLDTRLSPAAPQPSRESLAPGEVTEVLADVVRAMADALGLEALPLLVDFHGRTTPDSAGVVGNLATYLPVVIDVAPGDRGGVAASVRAALEGFRARHAPHVLLGLTDIETPEFVRISVFEETPRSTRDAGIADPGPVYGRHVDVTLLWSAEGLTLELSGPYDFAPVWSALREGSLA